MSSSFRFKASHPGLAAKEIAALRRICTHSILEIQRKASSREPVLDIPVFSGDWPAGKLKIVALLDGIETGRIPLTVHLANVYADSQESEEQFTVERARRHLGFLREIALQQDMQAQLEEGYIASPDEYVPLPEDEA